MYKNLFTGAAQYYVKYRYGYPNELFEALAQDLNLNGSEKLLDLGCGTGQVAIPLSKYFNEIMAIDPDEEMLQEAKKQAKEKGINNINWIKAKSEDLGKLGLEPGTFKLATMGRSFHWMDRAKTLSALDKLLETEGEIAIINILSLWYKANNWQEVVLNVMKKYLGEDRRAGDSKYVKSKQSFEESLSNSSFNKIWKQSFPFEYAWNVESIIGNLYSMSFCSPRLLGEGREAFEKEMEESLLKLNPENKFIEENSADVIFARRS